MGLGLSEIESGSVRERKESTTAVGGGGGGDEWRRQSSKLSAMEFWKRERERERGAFENVQEGLGNRFVIGLIRK